MPYPAAYLPFLAYPGGKWLNLALYADDGSVSGQNGAPTGIQFLARRPLLLESVTSFDEAAEANDVLWPLYKTISPFNAYSSYGDTAGAFGRGSDSPGNQATYGFYPGCPVSSGSGSGPNQRAGGWIVYGSFSPVTWATGQQATGAQLYQATASLPVTTLTALSTGSWQAAASPRDSCPFILDMLDTAPVAGDVITPAVAFAVTGSPATPALQVNPQDSSGETPRFFCFQAGASSWDAPDMTPALPDPLPAYEPGTEITSSLLNGSQGVCDAVNYLQYPPMMRVAAGLSRSVSSGTTTLLTYTASPFTNFTPQQNFLAAYQVPRDGLYLTHATTVWSASSAGARATGVSVNGTVYWGPGYHATASGFCVSTKTQVFSLLAGDVVQAACRQDSGSGLSLSAVHDSRFFMCWLGGIAGDAAISASPPDPGFRWQAGTPGRDLPGLLTAHLSGDLGFLARRPYFMGWQAMAQAGLPQDQFSAVTLDQSTGIVHGDAGTPWLAAGLGLPPGWYLVTGEVFAAPAPSGASVAAGIGTGPGPVPVYGTDWYQHMPASTSSSLPPGGTLASLYYLDFGITPQIMAQDYGGTYGTAAGAYAGGIVASHMEAVYLAQA